MSITTYKLEVLIGGHYLNTPEELFLELRDIINAHVIVQSLHLDCHYENCRISQMPDGGMFGHDDIRVESLDKARESDKLFDGLFQKSSISEEHGKSEQTRTDPHDPADDSQPVG